MRNIALMAIALTMLAPSPAVAAGQTVKAGIEAWQKHDYDRAIAIWRPLAEAGNADAAFNLGQAYRLGRGVPTNLSAAQTWLLRAASKDHLDAQSTLGLLLFDSGDLDGAMRWLKAAAERGEPRAQLVYGTALFNGDGVARNPVLGYAFVRQSAAQGLKPARGTLQDLQSILAPEQRAKADALAIASLKTDPAPVRAMENPIVAKPTPTPIRPTAKPAVAKTRSAQAPARAAAEPAVAKTRTASPPARVATNGGWRIQLGAFSKRSSAEALFKRWASALSGKQPVYSSAGTVTRLQVGPYPSKAAAQSACESLSRNGQACFAVAAK